MKKVIIIGGPTRSGTNAISSFLHLHGDVTIFHTLAGAFKFDLTNIWQNLQSMLPKYNLRLQKPFRLESDYWQDIFARKNEEIEKNGGTSIVGVRYDYVEKLMKGNSDVLVYFVYCMRDLKSLFLSLVANNYAPNNVQRFENQINSSLDAVMKLTRVFPIDVSLDNNYQGLLDWLQLEPNEHQREWIKQNPVVNVNLKVSEYLELKKQNVVISNGLLQRYSNAKEELLRRAHEHN